MAREIIVPASALRTPENTVRWIHGKALSIFKEGSSKKGSGVESVGGHRRYDIPGGGIVIARADLALDRIEDALAEVVKFEKNRPKVKKQSPLQVLAEAFRSTEPESVQGAQLA